MATINSAQETEVTYISGLTAGGILAAQSFWTWNDDNPATYGGTNFTAKFGSATPGSGANISYGFDMASGWTATEQGAFASTAALWAAVANITFTQAAPAEADIVITRATDGTASAGQSRFIPSQTGSASVGRALDGTIDIDTSVPSFGPLGAAFSEFGGYPYTVLLHEWGHVLGLGHGGAYDESLDISETALTAFDSRAWTLMSYIEPSNEHQWGTSRSSNNLIYGNDPTTPMPLDIVAIQRMYGVAVDTPLSGGQAYGFNSNIGGLIGKYFDFNQNSRPIVTLWNKGANNTLDVSGFGQASTINMNDGSFSSVAGLRNNLAIAFGTRIDTVVTGSGNDVVQGNNNGDFIMGGGGSDTITGGSGNDHLYGAAATAISGDGADEINGGAGSDYLQGNAGTDMLDGGDGSDRIQGGQGNDSITGSAGNDTVNGNLGNDVIDGGADNDSLRGGQGNDSIAGSGGNDIVMGDLGADSLSGGAGIDMLAGGGDGDIFFFAAGDAGFATSGGMANMTDMITDFADGVDRIDLSIGIPAMVIQGQAAASFATAVASAQQALGAQGGASVIVTQVGGDSFLFYDAGASTPLEAIKLQGVAAAAIGVADFV